MFALVRFVNEIDKTKRYIIPVKDTNDFYPLHLLDFDNKVTYSANWCDPNDEEDSGEYVVQILKLAETKEELTQMDKRTPVPPIHASDLEDAGSKDDDARTSRKTAMQESRKKIKNQLCTKKQQLAAVLEQHTKHALVNNAAAAGKTQAAPRRKRIKTSEECSDSSDDDDSVIALSELRNSEKEAMFWKSRYKLESDNGKLEPALSVWKW
ncbi:uncharacterized protein LOC125943997 [Dermacentor silvarum]|uniref:uncharacterized protein LOC125943997 n=1 Tax=Dermacentor silvarum TaxID=543639 RepID=UPI0021008B6B|nr:uncharacterized protein LOC125943997 [Dermacentor silvarum]